MRLAASATTRAAEGQTESGDGYVIRRHEGGTLHLVGVVDVLGHGTSAAPVARIAERCLRETSAESATAVVEDLHRALRGTRGAAALVCTFDGTTIEGCGVGNVNMRAVGCRVPVVLSPGILGGRVRAFHSFTAELSRGARLVLYSDGIVSHFEAEVIEGLGTEEACEAIMSRYRRPHDDATVLAVDAT